MKKRILVMIGSAWPGNDSAGPNLSIRSMCEALQDRFEFLLVARDRPFGASQAIVHDDRWHDVGYAKKRYLTVGPMGGRGLARLLQETPHELLWLNGFFDNQFSIPALVARRLRHQTGIPVLLSPRGEFTDGALALKGAKKTAFRVAARKINLHRDVHFHVTSEAELADCKAMMPDNPITLVTNSRALFPLPNHRTRSDGQPLRLTFLGRISKVKGLDFALEAMAAANVPALLDIYGPIADADHWRVCQKLIAALPPGVEAFYRGEIANSDAPSMFAAHDAMLLPSLSENFGHSIFESLASGTPVIIGNQTPWRKLASNYAGYDLPVGDVGEFAKALRMVSAQNLDEQMVWRQGARQFAEAFTQSGNASQSMADLYRRLIDTPSASAGPS